MEKRKLLVFFLVSFFAIPALGQQETLISGKVESGGFGGPALKFTHLNGEFGLFMGGRGGWIINHSFSLGGGWYFLSNEVKANPPNEDLDLRMNYGGLILEYIFQPQKITHFSVSVLFGVGGVSLYDRSGGNGVPEDNSTSYFVAEPGFSFIVNVANNFRIDLGASYRYINGVDLVGINEENLRGISANLTLKFGEF